MKRHLIHLASCAPMIAIALVGVLTGARLSCLVLMLGCIVAMTAMMGAMDKPGVESAHDRSAQR